MLISIIIPTRNRFEYINLLIDDILKQDVSNYEIIVVDQSDKPQAISNCRHIITDTLGPCVSRNLGVENAKGDILVFLDDDARIYSDFIREITSPIIQNRFEVVVGAVCDENGEYIKENINYLSTNNYNFIKVLTSNPDGTVSRITLSFPAGCSAIKKCVFLAMGGFDESFDPTGAGEDRDLALKLYKEGYAIWYNANAKLLHLNANIGGARDFGSRTLILDVHTYWICKKYFSYELAENLKWTIIRNYKKRFYRTFLKFKNIKTYYRQFKEVKKLLS